MRRKVGTLQRVPSTQGRHRAGARQCWKSIQESRWTNSFHKVPRCSDCSQACSSPYGAKNRVGSSAARNSCGWLRSRRRTMAFATLSCSFSRPENGAINTRLRYSTLALGGRMLYEESPDDR